jgi:hypothetical protein
VHAANNLQGLIYGAAALYEFDFLAPFNAVRFCIHQPRLNHYSEWAYSRAEIELFIAGIRPVAKLAYDLFYGNVDFSPKDHLIAGEEQCTWCPVRGACPARAKRVVDMFADVLVKHEIDDDALGTIYVRLDEIEAACKDFRAEALARALAGRKVPGHKLVRGKRGHRFWTDKRAAEAALSMMLDESKMYAPRELISPTQAEALLGKKKLYPSIKKYVDQPDGSLTLAPLSDEREAVDPVKFDVLPETAAS